MITGDRLLEMLIHIRKHLKSLKMLKRKTPSRNKWNQPSDESTAVGAVTGKQVLFDGNFRRRFRASIDVCRDVHLVPKSHGPVELDRFIAN